MNELVINKKDLISNIRKIKSRVDNDYTFIWVLKGNAYGLGMAEVAKILLGEGFNYMAVSTSLEALELRCNVDSNILLLTPYTDELMISELVKQDITITIDSEFGYKVVEKVAKKLNKRVKVHIKIDTGMSRFGFSYEDIDTLKYILQDNDNIEFEGIYSHFSNSFAKNSNYTKLQFERFFKVIDSLDRDFKLKHICNSEAFFRYEDMRLNAARLGSALLGRNDNLARIGLVHTKIIRIKDIKKGDIIGYGNSYKAKKNMKVAILDIGYYDGLGKGIELLSFKFKSRLKRFLVDFKRLVKSDQMLIEIGDTYYRVVGQINMYSVIIDITGKNFRENEDIYFYIKPSLVSDNIKRVYK